MLSASASVKSRIISFARSKLTTVHPSWNSLTLPIHLRIGTPDIVRVEMQRVYHVASNCLCVSQLAEERSELVRHHFDSAIAEALSLEGGLDELRRNTCDA